MAGKKRRAADRVLRAPLRSPGRPPGWRREHQKRFWEGIAAGLSSDAASVAVGLSPAVGTRWFRQSGGMQPSSFVALSGRYLSFTEREEIAVLNAQEVGVREIARQLGRSPSTISRELRRNAANRGGNLEYRASNAQWHADRQSKRPECRSSPRTMSCASTSRTGCRGRSPDRTAHQWLAPMFGSRAGGMAVVLIGCGPRRGVPSRSRTG